MIEFVTASHDDKILKENLLKGYLPDYNFLTVKIGFTNIPKAYNQVKSVEGILIAYMHHDIYLPKEFSFSLYYSVFAMEKLDKDWAVLGVAGMKGKQFHGYLKDRGKDIGSPNDLPTEVDTLDELLLITHGDFRFDENLPLHFYGADICMQAKEQGRKCYAINAYCHHNSSLVHGYRSAEFYECQEYFKQKWIGYLPIVTTCTTVTL